MDNTFFVQNDTMPFQIQIQIQIQKSFISIVTYQEYKDSRDWNSDGLICPHHLTITYIYMMTS